MSTELRMLAWTAGLTLVFWLPYILARMMNHGLVPTVTYAADAKPLPGWAERAKRAHYNAVENLAPFAAVVLVAQLAQATNASTAAAAIVYFWARVVHYLGQISGLPFVRTIAFGVGWAATMVIFLVIVT
ncbi:MAG: MAPEG family protein [Hyphomicrobiales bacterium]